MTTNFSDHVLETRLSLALVAQELHADGLLSTPGYERTKSSIGLKAHPLVFLSEQKYGNAAVPGDSLTMGVLLDWLGRRANQEVYRMDPLKTMRRRWLR